MISMIIDATNLVLGRLASYVAKRALLGENIVIVNCSKAVVSGRKNKVFKDYMQKTMRGIPTKGPFIYRTPDKFVKRTIRGMLPHKQYKGREALKRIRCYNNIPDKFKNEKINTVPGADVKKLPTLNYVLVEDICKFIGGL